eukprot:gi/632963893/ref/XP_007898133.1/ PREDICTED: BTB/POZ domain-containing protein 19 [Callorhinchus milii]
MSEAVAAASLRGPPDHLTISLGRLLTHPLYSDVEFIVGEEKRVVYAHRCVLACRCQLFHDMFVQQQPVCGPQEANLPFVFPNVQPDVFLAVLEFLYTNRVTLSGQIALEVLTSAVEYGLDDLRKLCVHYISSTLSVQSVCEALQAAVTYAQTDMKRKCLAFIEHHTKGIVKTQGFHELSDPALLAILQSDLLTIDEPDLITCVREWAHVNSVVLSVSVPDTAKEVVHELRLFLLDPEELTALEAENKKDNFIPVDKIAEVWKFHALKNPSAISSHLLQRRRGTQPREHHKYLSLHHKSKITKDF